MLVSLVLLAQANISPPPVELNHFFITVDQRTWNVIRSSKWVRDTFGQVSEGTFSDGKDTWTGFYVMGVGSYVEIFAPHGPFKEGDGGLALLTTTPGGADTLDYLFRKGYFGNRSRRELMSLSSASGMSPFAHILDYVGNKSNLSYWVMEYHELQYDRVGVPVGSSHAAMSAARRKQRGQTYDKLMGDIRSITLQPSSGLRDIQESLRIFGYAREGAAWRRGRNELVLLPPAATKPSYAITRVKFSLRKKPKQPHIERFGKRSFLKVSRDGTAEWRF